jgi:DNA-binding transcriptional LysR family regulator
MGGLIVAGRLNFRQIEAFRAVMLTGTTIAAANMLNTTQPSISRALGQMQAAAKLKLFELDRSRLRPTPEAVKLFEASSGISSAWRRLKRQSLFFGGQELAYCVWHARLRLV